MDCPGDAVVVIGEGRIAALGTPDQVFRPELIQKVFGPPVQVTRHPKGGWPVVVCPDLAQAYEYEEDL